MNNSLFEKADTLKEGDFRCMLSRNGGEIDLSGRSYSRYLFLFILQGKVDFRFTGQYEQLHTDSLIALDRESLAAAKCSNGTVILEYTPSERLGYYLGHCREVFRKPCSTPAPLLPPLRAWIYDLLERFGEEEPTEALNLHRRRKLDNILINYPSGLLGELHVPLFACSSGSNCDNCTNPTENHCSAK